MKLFELLLVPLFLAISQVESEQGKTSENIYQIKNVYVADVNRITNSNKYKSSDVTYKKVSEEMMIHYWSHYGKNYKSKTGKNPDYEVLARIHRGGPNGWKSKSTDRYWSKVKKELKELEELGVLTEKESPE